MDMRSEAARIFYHHPNPNYEEYLNKQVSVHLDKFEAWFGHFKTKYSASDEPTTGDFHLWEMIDQHQALAKSIGNSAYLGQYPHLSDFHKRFSELPAIAKYLQTPAYKYPANNKAASWK